ASLSIWGWGGLGVVLFFITFGPFAIFYLAFYIFCFIGGGFAVTLLYGKINSEKHLEKCEHSYLPPTQIGIQKTLDDMKLEVKPIKIDRRLTGSSFIDEPLQQVMFWDRWKKSEYPERTCTRENMLTVCRKNLSWDINPGPSYCKAAKLVDPIR
ncbi:sorting nexin 13, partial [Ameca splendens]